MLSIVIKNINRFLLHLDPHTLEVIKKSTASTIVKVVGMAIGLGVSIALGHLIGPEGLGIINLSTRIVTILIAVGMLGMQQVIIKEVAIAHDNSDLRHVGNVMNTAYWLNGGVTLTLSIIFIFLSPIISNQIFNDPRLTFPLIIFLLVMTPQVLSRIFSSALVGYRKIWQSNLVDQTLSLSVTAIALVIAWFLDYSITINLVAILFAVGRLAVTLTIGSYWNNVYKMTGEKKFIFNKLLKVSLPLLIVALSGIITMNTDVIMLGWLKNSKEVGLYSVAARIALLTSFFLQVTNSSVAPKIAALYHKNEISKLERMIQNVTAGLLIIGILTLTFFILAGTYVLSIWGKEFTNAYWVLIILGLGQLINLGTGAVGLLLIMTGYEKTQSRLSVLFMILNIIMNYILIQKFGAIGAAIALTITISSENIIKMYIVKRKIGVMSFPTLKIFRHPHAITK